MVDFNKYFYYKDGNIYNKISRGNKAKKNAKAGCIKKDSKYSVVMLHGKSYFTHRVIWQMHNGEIATAAVVDHIDHDRTNNKIENLRAVNKPEDTKNKTKLSNNTSGFCNVYWSTASNKWRVQLQVNGKSKHLGVFEDKELAELVSTEARVKYNFHENHGV